MPACAAHLTESQSVDDSYLFHPKFDPQGRQPFHFKTIHQYQNQDPALKKLLQSLPDKFFSQKLDSFDIICRHNSLQQNASWKIMLPDAMLHPLVEWYH
jgi:hypothetical protein